MNDYPLIRETERGHFRLRHDPIIVAAGNRWPHLLQVDLFLPTIAVQIAGGDRRGALTEAEHKRKDEREPTHGPKQGTPIRLAFTAGAGSRPNARETR